MDERTRGKGAIMSQILTRGTQRAQRLDFLMGKEWFGLYALCVPGDKIDRSGGLPALGAEAVEAVTEFDGTGGGAFEDVRHAADALGVFASDLGDVFFDGFGCAEDGDGPAGAPTSDLRAEEAGFHAAFAD